MIKIFIVDDHEIMRKSLQLILKSESDITVVGEATNGTDLLDTIKGVDCDILLLDLNMPGISGIELISELIKLKPKLKILVLSIQPEKKYALKALNAGASGYISKDSALNELVFALRKMQSNGRYLSAAFTELLAFGNVKSNVSPPELLTDIENQIMISLASGKSVKDIADNMSIKISTVLANRIKIFKKLKLDNNIELTHYAFENKLI